MVLLRQLLGDVLRQLQLRQGRTLREVSAAARGSLGYLSAVERGQKAKKQRVLARLGVDGVDDAGPLEVAEHGVAAQQAELRDRGRLWFGRHQEQNLGSSQIG